MKQLTKRQLNIFKFITGKSSANNGEIKEYLGNISRSTVVRDLDALLKRGLIKQEGRGRSVRYLEKVKSKILRYLDAGDYFEKSPDQREVAFERFNFGIFKELKEIFTKDELTKMERLNNNYKERVKKLSPTILKKEFERLTIELSWKSSRLEGNTYSLLDTEVLIKDHKEAAGHKKEEAIMILNHKKALDYIADKKSDFQNITLRKIENIQNLIVADMDISKGLRKKPVGIVGTRYRPLDNEYQAKEAMEKTVILVNSLPANSSLNRTTL